MKYGFDVINVWTHATVNEIECMLQHELGGEFVCETCGSRFLRLRRRRAEVAVRFADNMVEETDPNILVFIDRISNDESVDQQRMAAIAVFDALARATFDRLELRAEDDSPIRSRPAATN